MAKTEKQILAEIVKLNKVYEEQIERYSLWMKENPANSAGYSVLIGTAIGKQQALEDIENFITGETK